MPAFEMPGRAFVQHAERRAVGQPTPAVLVGPDVVDAWIASLGGRELVRTPARDVDDAVRAYLAAEPVASALDAIVTDHIEVARGSHPLPRDNERTRFEHTMWLELGREALLAAGVVDVETLAGYLLAGERNVAALRVFGAAVRVLAKDASAFLVELAPGELDIALRIAIALAEAAPSVPLAVVTTAATWADWQATSDREHAKAILRPCVVELPRPAECSQHLRERARVLATLAIQSGRAEDEDRARSAAERALFDGLEASPRSRGCFRLNHALSDVTFGNRPLEIDLACPSLRIAVEVDGYFHFKEADAYRRDRRKDVVLQGEGYFVVRVLAEDVVADLAESVATIHRVMAYRSKEMS